MSDAEQDHPNQSDLGKVVCGLSEDQRAIAADPDVCASPWPWRDLSYPCGLIPSCMWSSRAHSWRTAWSCWYTAAPPAGHTRISGTCPGGMSKRVSRNYKPSRVRCSEELGVRIVVESSSRLGDLRAGSGEDAVHVGVWLIGDWDGSPANRAPDEHDDIAWVAPANWAAFLSCMATWRH